jgi:hypothetical protein
MKRNSFNSFLRTISRNSKGASVLMIAAIVCYAACDTMTTTTTTTDSTSTTTTDGSISTTSTVIVIASDQLQPSDFNYQGAFRLPEECNWGSRGLSYYPAGNGGAGSLLVTGFDQTAPGFAQVSIPEPGTATDWQELPVATMLTPMTNFDGGLVASYDSEYESFYEHTVVSGIQYVPQRGSQTSDKLYGSIDFWYGVIDESHPTIWIAEMDGSNARGLYHAGPWVLPYHGNKSGDYLFSVPQWYADMYLGGRTLVTGKTRGAFNGSQGPTLFAFMPWDSENPSGDLDAVPMLWYNIYFPACAGPNEGDKANCDYPDFTMCDKWEGGGFVESGEKRAMILLGSKGLGDNTYGTPPPPADACEGDQGYHCDPFERQVIFYDVDELGAVAGGSRDAWTVLPYITWRPEEFYLGDAAGQTCGQVGGMAVDTGGQLVFIIEKGLGGHTNENQAVVHVWSLP